ncbi:TonB-dependent receptor plug domain-containing protein [Phenylobacterium sp.]|jgi:vitamin B12 transporter|uniref:TonB-dependent receptor plug domain-containing protein n=1 Tax=Phenylobacterium sp. TaxID=1871053 RepID=UPI002E328F0F|nr:TonB-dependent receptor [Phenylobacterium sp.]HEX4712609.1 TonB-dependent receptor [Phenylobacterium sp.]
MPGYLLSASILALAAAIPLTAFAADDPVPSATVQDLVVTATRAPGGIEADQIGGSLTLITPQQMEDRQIRVVSDVLRDVPGVAVSRTGAVGDFTQVRVRGTESNHVLTLIDGIKASDPFFGEFDYATLLADDVSRVEVLRGQQSALYGSDAIGGVINYITPTGAQAPGIRVRAEGGSMNTAGGAARVAGVQGGLDYVLSAAYQHTDGYPVATVGTRDIGSTLKSLAVKLAYPVADHLRLRGVYRRTETDADVNGQDFGTTGFVLDSPGSSMKADNTYGFAAADFSFLDDRWLTSLQVQGVDAVRNNIDNFVRDGGDKGKRLKESVTSSYKLVSGELTHTFTLAYDHERESYENTNPPGPFNADTTRRSVSNDGYVGEYDLAVGDLAGVRGAVRYDRNDFFQDATTYRIEGFYRLNDRVRLRAAAGSGIKGPSQTELFGFNAGAFPFVGNPNLKPERSQGWEAGVDFALVEGRVRLGATWFDSTLHDEIFSIFGAPVALCTVPGQPAPLSCSTTGNEPTKSTQKGLELSADARLSDAFSLNAAYTYLDARQNGVEEVRRPKNMASANLTWHAPGDRGSVTLTARYNGDMTDEEFKTFSTVTLKAFTLVNLAGAYTLTDHVELFARVENLLDERYFEVFNFRTPGRAAYGGVRLRF